MYAQNVVVHFRDGSTKDVTLTQWSVGQFAQFAQNKGWKISLGDPGLLAVTMLRFQAFAELHRDPNMPRPSFDAWDLTVSEVDSEEEAEVEVDPTQKATSGGSSLKSA